MIVVGVRALAEISDADIMFLHDQECLYELLRYPDIQNKLRDELLAFARMTGREPTYDDLTSGTHLFYLDAVTRETMRTKAVLMTITREVRRSFKIT